MGFKSVVLVILAAAAGVVATSGDVKPPENRSTSLSSDPSIRYFQEQVNACLAQRGKTRQDLGSLESCRDKVSSDQDRVALNSINDSRRWVTAKLHQELNQDNAESTFDVEKAQELLEQSRNQTISLTEYMAVRKDYQALAASLPGCLKKHGFEAADLTELSKKYTDLDSEYAEKDGLSESAFHQRAHRAMQTYRKCHDPIQQYVIDMQIEVKRESQSLDLAATRLGL